MEGECTTLVPAYSCSPAEGTIPVLFCLHHANHGGGKCKLGLLIDPKVCQHSVMHADTSPSRLGQCSVLVTPGKTPHAPRDKLILALASSRLVSVFGVFGACASEKEV